MKFAKYARAAVLAAMSGDETPSKSLHALDASFGREHVIHEQIAERLKPTADSDSDSDSDSDGIEVRYLLEGKDLEYSVELTFTWSL